MKAKTKRTSNASASKKGSTANKVSATRSTSAANRKPVTSNEFHLNHEQVQASNSFATKPIVVLHGPAGTGKSAVACYVGLKRLMAKDIDRIIITRPAIASEDLGYLPGDLNEKVEGPYAAPLVKLINMMGVNPARGSAIDYYNNLKASGKLEFIPMGFLRGHTFDNSFVIADEMQNSTPAQIKTLITRIGKNTSIAITGDTDQCDLPKHKVPVNGLEAVLQLSNHTPHVVDHLLTICERNPIIEDLLRAWPNIKLN